MNNQKKKNAEKWEEVLYYKGKHRLFHNDDVPFHIYTY